MPLDLNHWNNRLAGISAKAEGDAVRRIPLDAIDEDPDQPRRHFDEAGLRTLADSIALPDTGLLQPITVRPAEGGRYVVVYGARRLRAVKLLGWADIPAIVRDDKAGLAGQVIENRQRQDNTDSELSDAIAVLTEQKRTNAEIATILALTDPQSVRYYRALTEVRLLPELAGWIDRADARALYELHNAWRKEGPGQAARHRRIVDALAVTDELTIAAARRIVAAAEQADALEARDKQPVQAAHTIAPQPETTPPRPARQRSAPARDDADPAEADRVAKVRAWLDSPLRPRPPLNV